ncbi:hypothetical protein NSK_002597 [Nannochloropsis salina CCMP1776]|uniref:Uncharacterized protein n=1 Tax=Nannochloropsis salina CCMP1776 TaxID=1027361 RepID=A0A4D9DCX1_9STRA|nr:hypothetical protein NSK_002597 [Nannochloropsis salina CCMP1776]|eukprot:TFJ86389.1 hypothetical protein NSK_002597 [Nannochloropsis salina CCMP1776]
MLEGSEREPRLTGEKCAAVEKEGGKSTGEEEDEDGEGGKEEEGGESETKVMPLPHLVIKDVLQIFPKQSLREEPTVAVDCEGDLVQIFPLSYVRKSAPSLLLAFLLQDSLGMRGGLWSSEWGEDGNQDSEEGDDATREEADRQDWHEEGSDARKRRKGRKEGMGGRGMGGID